MIPFLAEIAIASFLALLPTMLLLRRNPAALGRREASVALHRLRLREVDRDLDHGLLAGTEHGAARLEIQRRLLAEAETADPFPSAPRRFPLVLTVIAVPVAAFVLYDIGGHPGLGADPIGPRLAATAAADREDGAMMAQLRADIAALPLGSTRRREGETLLGQAEAADNHWRRSADAFDAALADGPFDPGIAVEAAEARTRAEGGVSPASAALFKRAVAAAPPGAPWRTMAEERIAESEHAH